MLFSKAKKNKVLVIEDEINLVKEYALKLSNAGYEVLEAFSGKEGLEKVKKQKPDLVILDIKLPDTNGYDLLPKIKKEHEIPVIIATNLGHQSDLDKGIQKGADDYIVKGDVSVKKLVEIVDRFLKPSQEG